MAAKKKTTKRAGTRKAVKTAQLPKGYEPITAFAPSWQYEEEPLLEGTIKSFGEHTVIRGKGRNAREETQRTCIVERKDGTVVTVWESATLRGLFDECEEGEQIAIAFQGLGVAKPGQNPPKLFAVGYK